MPRDQIPKFIALPCPCEPPRPEKVVVKVQKPLKPPPRASANCNSPCWDSTSSSLGNLKSTRISTSSWRLHVSTEQTLSTSTRSDFSDRRRLDMGKDELEAVAFAAATSEDWGVECRSLKEYFERSKELIIRSDGLGDFSNHWFGFG